MSKLIVEMNMPEHGECDAAIMSKYGSVCLIAKMGCAYPFTNTRPKDCPIKGEVVERFLHLGYYMWREPTEEEKDKDNRTEAGVYVNGEVAFINGGPEDENEFALDETEDVDK